MNRILGAHEKTYYFALWNQEQTWGKVVVLEEHIRMESNKDERKYKWMTKSQILKLYQDQECADELCKAKLQDPTMNRPHPEMAHVQTAWQYKVLVDDSQTNVVENILRQGMRMTGAVDGAEGAALMQQQTNRTAVALGRVPGNQLAAQAVPPMRSPLSTASDVGTEGPVKKNA